MRTVAAVARSQLRATGRRGVLTGVVVGLALGVLLAATAGARRTETAVDRFATRSLLPDTSFYGPNGLVDEAARMDGVRTAARSIYAPLSFVDVPEDERDRIVPFASIDAHHLRHIERPLIVAGRLPDPKRQEEIAISEKTAERRHVGVGSVMRARTFLPPDLETFEARGPIVRLRVTGVIRQLADLARTADQQGDFQSGEETVYLTPAFWRAHVRGLPGFGENAGLAVDLDERPGAMVRFKEAVIRANGGVAPGEEEGASGFFDPTEQTSAVRRAVSVSATALYAFAALTAVAIAVLVGQSLYRQAREDAAAFTALTAIGLSRRQFVAGAALRSGATAVLAAGVGVLLAVVLSPLLPFGLARLAEPDPGAELNAAVLLAGALVGMFALMAVATASSWLAARAVLTGARPLGASTVARQLGRVGASAAAVTGARFALEPGRGSTALPVRSTLTAAVLAAAAMTAAVTFSAGFDHVLDESRLQGAPWDIIVGSPRAEHASAEDVLEGDRRVASVAKVLTADATVGHAAGLPLLLAAVEGTGEMLPPAVRGRVPRRRDEVAVTNRSAERIDVDIGDRFEIAADGATSAYRVVGVVPFDHQLLADHAGSGVLITPEAFVDLVGEAAGESHAVRWRDGVDEERARDDMHARFESAIRPIRSPDVRNLVRVRWLPQVLAAVLSALGLATLVHALVAAVRRRRRDLALLKTLGFDRRQVARAVRWQAAIVAGVAGLVAVPTGVAAGRWTWRLVGERIGVVAEPVVPWPFVIGFVPLLIALGVAISAGPARMAARTRPAVVLRTE